MIITQQFFKKMISVAAAAFVVGCAPRAQSVDQASQNLSQAIGCTNMKGLVYDAFYEMIDQTQSVPLAVDMKESLKSQLNQMKSEKNLTASERKIVDQMLGEFNSVIDLMLEQAPGQNPSSWKEQVQKIIEYEMQDQSSDKIIAGHQKINRSLDRVSILAKQTSMNCSAVSTPVSSPVDIPKVPTSVEEPLALASPVLIKGINRVFATAYQSCRVVSLPPLDNDTPDVQGITRLAENHTDGIGGKRIITDLKAVQKTHYYVRGIATESSCARVADNPLIYDYGGEPAISGTTLNYFKNSGSGTQALGVDCSAFVSSAVAVAGMRYKPNLENKPIYTRQNSAKFIDATKSGFTCFDNITVTPTQSVLAGDIVAVSGHVVIVDRIGLDPFGLNAIAKESACANLDYKNFDIDVAQSSPSKQGIGLNKFKLRDYLDETSKMRTAFVEMGKKACVAKFKKISEKPSSSAWGFIRHKGTQECLAPRVSLTGEACAQSCF